MYYLCIAKNDTLHQSHPPDSTGKAVSFNGSSSSNYDGFLVFNTIKIYFRAGSANNIARETNKMVVFTVLIALLLAYEIK